MAKIAIVSDSTTRAQKAVEMLEGLGHEVTVLTLEDKAPSQIAEEVSKGIAEVNEINSYRGRPLPVQEVGHYCGFQCDYPEHSYESQSRVRETLFPTNAGVFCKPEFDGILIVAPCRLSQPRNSEDGSWFVESYLVDIAMTAATLKVPCLLQQNYTMNAGLNAWPHEFRYLDQAISTLCELIVKREAEKVAEKEAERAKREAEFLSTEPMLRRKYRKLLMEDKVKTLLTLQEWIELHDKSHVCRYDSHEAARFRTLTISQWEYHTTKPLPDWLRDEPTV